MEDIRIGRKCYSEEKVIAVTATSLLAVPANDDRVGLILDNLGPNDVFLSTSGDITSTTGLRIIAGDPPVKLTVAQHGQFVTRGMRAICAAAQTATLIAWSTYLPDK